MLENMPGAIVMETAERLKQHAADLHWLAMLLTGSRETATNVTEHAIKAAGYPDDFFSTWMNAWSRKIVIAKALATVRENLAQSARRLASTGAEKRALPSRPWELEEGTTKADLEQALLRLDSFPRAAVLLVLFEGVSLTDAATLLDSEPDVVRTAIAAGVSDLTTTLARMQGWKIAATRSNNTTERQHA